METRNIEDQIVKLENRIKTLNVNDKIQNQLNGKLAEITQIYDDQLSCAISYRYFSTSNPPYTIMTDNKIKTTVDSLTKTKYKQNPQFKVDPFTTSTITGYEINKDLLKLAKEQEQKLDKLKEEVLALENKVSNQIKDDETLARQLQREEEIEMQRIQLQAERDKQSRTALRLQKEQIERERKQNEIKQIPTNIVKKPAQETLVQTSKSDQFYKIVLIGDSGAGKTSLINRYHKKSFEANCRSTLGIDFVSHPVQSQNGTITLQIWDTAGQERFNSLSNSYYRGVHAFILCVDLTRSEGLNNLQKWLEVIEKYTPSSQNIPVLLVGTKCDLNILSGIDQCLLEFYEKQNYTAGCFKTSANTGEGVEEAFASLINELEKIYVPIPQTNTTSIQVGIEEEQPNNSCGGCRM